MTAITFLANVIGSANNGGNVTLTYPASGRVPYAVSVVAVTLGTSRAAPSITCTTSSGFAYSKIVTDVTSSNAHFSVFRRVLLSTAETAATVTGTGNSSDATSGVCHIFSNVDVNTPEDATATSTSGASTTPDSPSITVVSSGCAIISAIGTQLIGFPTAPSSFLNSLSSLSGSDNWDCTTGQAWVLNASTAAFNPTSWTSSATTSWCSATIALRRAYELGFAIGADSDDSTIRELQRVVIRSY